MSEVEFNTLFEIPLRNGLTKPSKVRGTGNKMINMGELFANGRIYDIPMDLVPLKESEKLNCKVLPSDLLFARQSLVLEGAGKCSIVMETSTLTVFESHLIRVRLDRTKADPLFYYYYFNSPCSPIPSIVSQCAQAGIKGSDLSVLKVKYPPLSTQHRIANILSRYDSLIENYQKQIKLLEEAAQRLYKEWFIDLHFPGHENTNIIDGVPEGWEKKKVGELLIKHIGGGWGKDTPTGSYDVGGHVIRGTDITQIENGNMNVPYRYHTESNLKDRRLKEGDIIFEVSGGSTNEPVGRTLFITNELVSYFGNNTICASFCKKMSFRTIQESVIAYFTIRYFRKIGYLHKYEKDSAGKIINYNWNDFLNEFDILFPNQVMLDNISARLQKIITEASKLRSQLRLLTEARDRLLPKLMSGAIEV